jgi:eukaryotic-like serine/threonine-protein kinase
LGLSAGQRLGPYAIVAPLGAGGMGEVYRATDTKLGRDVAIKVLPAEVAGDPERLARFEREARLLASLNHPNIAAIHGLEEADGKPFLVLELVEGEDLSERLKRGALPVDEALGIAKQIAEALEEAHEKGIVHRDLKPANVKLTPDGKVKVLDFGLAKAYGGDATSGSSADLSQSPTLAHTGTLAGAILGTAAYMSPEQARGKPVDRRADVWAFGAVLYEMLSGRQLFGAETVSDIVAAVLTREPDWALLPAATPPRVRTLLERCLDRDVRGRLQAIGEARLVLEKPHTGTAEGTAAASRPSSRVLTAAIAAGVALFAAGWLLRSVPRAEETVVRKVDLSIADLDASLGRMPRISPDGSRVVYVAAGHLRVRRLDRMDAVELPESDDVLYPSWSPDSRQLTYVRHGRAWKVSTEGGQPTDLGAVPDDLVGSGGSAWTGDGRIVFAGSDTVGLWEVPAAGGAGRELLTLDRSAESDVHEIAALPQDRGLIFTVHRKGRPPDMIAALAGGSRRTLLEVSGESLRHPVYSPTGHLVYERETTSPGIWAVPFSLAHLETTGSPFLVVPGGSAPSLAHDGTLCLVRPEESSIDLVRVSRGGVVETVAKLAGTSTSMLTRLPLGTGYRASGGVSLSPDGSRVALSLGYAPGQLFVYDLGRGSLSNVARDTFPSRPIWTRDGERLIYASAHGARAWNLSSRRADAAGDEERLSTSDEVQLPLAISPDGASLVYVEGSGPKGSLLLMPPDASGPARALFPSRVWGLAASFSPDGRFLAYESAEPDRIEVFVRPFPEGNERFQLSTGGGEAPVWSRSGEVFYLAGGGISSVSVTSRGGSLKVSTPTLLFRTGGETHLAPVFDVTPDGQRFLMLRSRGSEHVSLILNWPRELNRLLAAGSAQGQ